MSAYRTLRLLYKYLFYTGTAKDYNRSIPLIIKVDPIIVYLRHYIRIAICPFCGRKFRTVPDVEAHLVNSEECGRRFREALELTVDRYLLFRSHDFRRKAHSLIKKYYRVEE